LREEGEIIANLYPIRTEWLKKEKEKKGSAVSSAKEKKSTVPDAPAMIVAKGGEEK